MPDDLATPPVPGTHRFADWHDGQHYAFARGLNVAPCHLPLALDAMHEAGWELAAVFGETSADKIGFLFRRSGYNSKLALFVKEFLAFHDDDNRDMRNFPAIVNNLRQAIKE